MFPDRVESYHERGQSRLINILTNAHFAGMLPRSLLFSAWQQWKQPELNAQQKPYYIEVSNHLYGAVLLLPELWSQIQIVHIVRDPRSYVRSHVNWARHRAKSFIANYLVPFWQPNPYLIGEMRLGEWIRLSKFEHFCWIWDFKNRKMAELEHADVPYLRIYFEDFFQADHPEVSQDELLHFMGLPVQQNTAVNFSRRVNPTQTKSFPSWPDWTPQQCARLDQICGASMRKFGYGGEAEWQKKVTLG
ncbi:MAG: hypothetical protein KC413_21785, partial [Anaerolineales bacterium]|nr:hypothetical protein [Anaerolineales bacterium]